MTTYGVPLVEDVTGVRQELTVVLPVRLLRVPDWPEGPFPFELGSRRTDAQTRSTYFAPASARALYWAPGRPRRWHLPLDVKNDGLHLLGMELLRAATARNPEHALVVLHLSEERPLLPILTAGPGGAAAEPRRRNPHRALRPGRAPRRHRRRPQPRPAVRHSPALHHRLHHPHRAARPRPPHRRRSGAARHRGPLAVATGLALHTGGLPPAPGDRRRTTQGRPKDLGRLERPGTTARGRLPRPPARHRCQRLLRIRRTALTHRLPRRPAPRLTPARPHRRTLRSVQLLTARPPRRHTGAEHRRLPQHVLAPAPHRTPRGQRSAPRLPEPAPAACTLRRNPRRSSRLQQARTDTGGPADQRRPRSPHHPRSPTRHRPQHPASPRRQLHGTPAHRARPVGRRHSRSPHHTIRAPGPVVSTGRGQKGVGRRDRWPDQ